MEDIVYLLMNWQLEAEIYVSDCLEDSERPISLWSQFLGRVCDVKVCSFQPNSFPFMVRFVIDGFDLRFLCMLHCKCRFLLNGFQILLPLN